LPVLFLRPDGPVAAGMVLFAGGAGRIGIEDDGTIRRDGNFLVRTRASFAARGFLVAVVDAPDDRRTLLDWRTDDAHAADIAAVIARLRALAPAPVWLIGTSRGAISAAFGVARLGPPPAGPDGVVLSAAVTGSSNRHPARLADVDVARIRVPVLLLHHKADDCPVSPWSGMDYLKGRFGNAPSVALSGMTGGDPGAPSDRCWGASHHGFQGVEDAAIDAIAAWIGRHGEK